MAPIAGDELRMAETSGGAFTGERGSDGQAVLLASPRCAVSWEADGRLALAVPGDSQTRIAGGMLVELMPSEARRVDESGVVRLAPASDASEPQRIEDAHGSGLRVVRTLAAIGSPPDAPRLAAEAAVCVYDGQTAAVLRITLRNVGDAAIALRRAFPFVSGVWDSDGVLRLAGKIGDFSVYKNGWQSWSYAGGLPPDRADPRPRNRTLVAWHSPGGAQPRQPFGGVVDVVSEEMGMLGATGLPVALLAGFLDANRWLGQIYMQRRAGALAAAVLLDDYALAPGGTLALPPLWLALGPQAELPPAYAAAAARELGARRSEHVFAGWCSWYFYYTGVSEAGVMENLAALRSLEQSVPVELVQIDDGYQAAIGDWLSVNAKFPAGMAALARRIREAGYRPGIWLAPFTISATSRLAREHPEWLMQDPAGRPAFAGHNWGADLYALDTTHPGARDWLRAIFTTLVREWGYDYLKLDFLACGTLAGPRHDPQATRASALRDGLALIREVVGDEVYLLGCGCPLLSAVGIVDAMRIGPDSAPHWGPRFERVPVPFAEGHSLPTMEGAIRNTLTRAWMHPTFWTNDPDCLLVREQRSELTLDEVRAFATAVGLSGGMVVVSDRLPDLPPERLEILARLLPPLPARALPNNYFAFGIPARVQVSLDGATGPVQLIGLFNGEDGDREMALTWAELGLPRGMYHTAELWSGAYLGASATSVTVRLAPHGAAALAIRPATGEPALLSTSYHIGQGACDVTAWAYDRERGEVRWRVELGRTARGTVSLWLPPGMSPRRVTSSNGPASWHRNATGEVVVAAEVRSAADFTLMVDGSRTG